MKITNATKLDIVERLKDHVADGERIYTTLRLESEYFDGGYEELTSEINGKGEATESTLMVQIPTDGIDTTPRVTFQMQNVDPSYSSALIDGELDDLVIHQKFYSTEDDSEPFAEFRHVLLEVSISNHILEGVIGSALHLDNSAVKVFWNSETAPALINEE